MARQRGPVRGSTRRTREARKRAANRPLVTTGRTPPVRAMNKSLQTAVLVVGFIMLAALVLSMVASLLANQPIQVTPTPATQPVVPGGSVGGAAVAYAADGATTAPRLTGIDGAALRFGGHHPSSWDDDQPPTASLAAPPTAQTAADLAGHRVYIGETGHFLSEPFLSAWQAEGGARAFGNPISEAFVTGSMHSVQYFENSRLEADSSAGTAKVTVGTLGQEYALLHGYALATGAFAPKPKPGSTDVHYFPETQHGIAFGFKNLWENLAQTAGSSGAQLLGAPISDEMTEDGLTVQYFERGRLEVRDGKATISPLGDLYLAAQGWSRPIKAALDVSPSSKTTADSALPGASVAQGKVVEVRFDSTAISTPKQPAADVALVSTKPATTPAMPSGTFGPATFAFVLSPDKTGAGFHAVGLAAIAHDATLGPQSLRTQWTDAGGRSRAIDRIVSVTATQVAPHQQLELTPELVAIYGKNGVNYDNEETYLEKYYATLTPEKLWQGTWTWPLRGQIFTEYAQPRSYGTETRVRYHGGLDIGAELGTSVRAPAAGRVLYTDKLTIRGNMILIDHGDGLISGYFHLSQILVKAGDMVQQGDIIARAGGTGLSTGGHLHWETQLNGVIVDPRTFIDLPL